ncbi:T9SS type A sorting domain-containing protein [Dyadobacter endophyticus]|uniref:T9SS type A sorting domain-containing protein n=1 Tax=Dyadobacter TaxID=120831 RepID=UPI003CEF31B4
MKKSIGCFVASSGFKVVVLVLIAYCNAFAQFTTSGCYEFKPVSNASKRLTNVNGVLKIQDANNSDSQVFYVGGQAGSSGSIAILAQGTNSGFLSTVDRNIGTPIHLMKASDFPPASPNYGGCCSPKWQALPVNDGSTDSRYNITRYHDNNYLYPVVGFGANNWGNGDPNSPLTDIHLASAADLNVYGANKWYLSPKSCPANYCDFQLNMTASNYNPVIGTAVTLNANCSGNCEGINYRWSPSEYSGFGTSFTLTAGANGQLGPYPVTVIATKAGCPTKTQSFNLNVIPAQNGFSQCKEAETSTGTGAITSDPNASNGGTRGEENNYNHYVDYSITGVPFTGTYNVTLRYYSSSAPSVNISVSQSGFSQNVNLVSGGTWNIAWKEQTIPVNLVYGDNTIKITGIGGGSCRQDKLCVSGSSNLRIGTEEIIDNPENDMTISPNPNNGEFEVDFFLASGTEGKLSVADMKGAVVQERRITGTGNHKEKISLLTSPAGTYLVRILRENGQEVKKALVIR